MEQIKAAGLAREIHLETNITQDELGNGEYTEKAKRYNNNQSKTIVDITIGNPDLGQFDGFIELTCNLMFENKQKSAKFVNALTREGSKLDVEADRLKEAFKIGLCNDAFLCIVDDRFADATDAFPMLEHFIHEKYDSVTLLPVIGVGYYRKLDILQNAGESPHSSLYRNVRHFAAVSAYVNLWKRQRRVYYRLTYSLRLPLQPAKGTLHPCYRLSDIDLITVR